MSQKKVLLSTIALPKATNELESVADDVDLANLPRRVDRRGLADLVRKFYFPVSHRSIEAWPLLVKRVNGKATLDTREGLAYAKSKLDAAPAIRGGRRSGNAAP